MMRSFRLWFRSGGSADAYGTRMGTMLRALLTVIIFGTPAMRNAQQAIKWVSSLHVFHTVDSHLTPSFCDRREWLLLPDHECWTRKPLARRGHAWPLPAYCMQGDTFEATKAPMPHDEPIR